MQRNNRSKALLFSVRIINVAKILTHINQKAALMKETVHGDYPWPKISNRYLAQNRKIKLREPGENETHSLPKLRVLYCRYCCFLQYVWRLNDQGLLPGFPAEINQLFKFPMEVEHVDAVYERTSDSKIVFFIGKLFYIFNTSYLEPGYPKPLTVLGLPQSLDRVDGAMVWGYNKKTYFFSGTMYWK